jgi:soluble lytic murein transglycosylase-like protein
MYPAAAALLVLWAALPARADTLLLTSGRQLEVDSVEFTGDGAEVVLEGGGRIRLPLEAVEAVLAAPGGAASGGGPPPSRYDELILEVARRHGVEPALVRAVVAVESAFDCEAVSPRGAVGLMQLLPSTAAEYGITDLTDPRENLEAGVRHLGKLIRRFEGNLDLILAAYNAGEGRVRKAGGVPAIRETRTYVERVKETLHRGNRI